MERSFEQKFSRLKRKECNSAFYVTGSLLLTCLLTLFTFSICIITRARSTTNYIASPHCYLS